MRRRTESSDLDQYEPKSGRYRSSNHHSHLDRDNYNQSKSKHSRSRSKFIDSSDDDDIPKPTYPSKHRSRVYEDSDDNDSDNYKHHNKYERKPIKRPSKLSDDDSDSEEFINRYTRGKNTKAYEAEKNKTNGRNHKVQIKSNDSPITHRNRIIDSSSSPLRENAPRRKVETKHTHYKPSKFQLSSDSDSDEVFRKLAEKYTRPKNKADEEKREPVYHSVSKQINISSSDSEEFYFQKKSKKVNTKSKKETGIKRPQIRKPSSDSDSDSPEYISKRSRTKSPAREQPKLKAYKKRYISSDSSSNDEEYTRKSKHPIVPILSDSSEDEKPRKTNKNSKKPRKIISSSDSEEKIDRKEGSIKKHSATSKRSIQSILEEISDDSSDDELFQLTVPNILKDLDKTLNSKQEKKKTTTKDIFFEDAKKSPNRPKNTSKYDIQSPSLKISGSISHQSPSRKSPYANRVKAPVPFDFGKPKGEQPKGKKKHDEFDDSDSIDELIKKSSAIATTSYQVKLSNDDNYINDLSDSDDDDELIKRVNDHLARSRLGRSMFDSEEEKPNEPPKEIKKPINKDEKKEVLSKPPVKPPTDVPKPQKMEFSDDSEPSDFDDPPPPSSSSSPVTTPQSTPVTDSISLTPTSTPQKQSDNDDSDGSVPSLNMPKPNTPEWTEWIKKQVASLEKDSDSNSENEEVKPEAVVVSKKEAEPIEAPKESLNRAPSDFFLPDDNDNADYDPHDSSFAADSEDEDDEEKHRSPIEEIKKSESEHQLNASISTSATVPKELPKPKISIDTFSDVSDTSGDDLNSEELRALLNKHFSSDYDEEDQ